MQSNLQQRGYTMIRNWIIALYAALLMTLLPAVSAAGLTLITEENPPVNFTQNGKLTGFSTQIVREILKRLGRSDPIQVLPWARGYQMLQQKPDVVLFSTIRSKEREHLFKWAGPLCIEHWGFYARRDSALRIRSLEDAKRVRAIATYRDDAKEQFLKAHGFTNLDSSNSPFSNLKKLMSGRVDLWLDRNMGMPQIARQVGVDPGDLKLVFAVTSADLYIAFSKAMPPSVVAAWQRTLDRIKADGTFTRIAAHWLPADSIPPDVHPPAPPLAIYTENSPPGNFLENGVLKGFAVDIVREIQRRLNHSGVIFVVPWARGYHLALTRPNTALFSTTRLPQREKHFKWVGPLYRQQWKFYGRRGHAPVVDSIEAAKKVKRIGTYRNDAKEQFLQGLGFGNLVRANKNISNVRHLMDGRIDLWASSDFNASFIARQAGVDPQQIEPVYDFRKVENYIAFSLQTPDDLVSAWQQALDQVKADGTCARIAAKWDLATKKDNPCR